MNVIIKTRYNDKDISLNLKKDNKVYFHLYYNYKIFEEGNRKFY